MSECDDKLKELDPETWTYLQAVKGRIKTWADSMEVDREALQVQQGDKASDGGERSQGVGGLAGGLGDDTTVTPTDAEGPRGREVGDGNSDGVRAALDGESTPAVSSRDSDGDLLRQIRDVFNRSNSG